MSISDNSLKGVVENVLKDIDLGAIKQKIENGEFDINKLTEILKSIVGKEKGEQIIQSAKKIADNAVDDDSGNDKYYR